MRVFPIFENAAFEAALTALMGNAFDRALAEFKFTPPLAVQEAIANRILEAAHSGERDVNRLRDAALTGTGLTGRGERVCRKITLPHG